MAGGGYALSSRGRKLQRSQWRMLLEWLNQQLPAVAPITLSTAPGRGGEAARPVRKAHREKPEKLPKNKLACFIGIFLAFLMPGSSLDVIQVTGGNKFGFFRLLHRPLRSRRRILLAQRFGGRGGLQRFPFASFCFLCSILIRYQYQRLLNRRSLNAFLKGAFHWCSPLCIDCLSPLLSVNLLN